MASINSLSGGGSTSSIYGNANIISGLASGMDTEAMIENAVSGIQKKIANLQQDRTMLEWEQEAYRSIIDKMVNFANKYTSFSSSSNLLSEAFFRNALSVSTAGTNAEKVTASGRTSSDVQILGVKQLASAATYSIAGIAGSGNTGNITGDAFNLNGNTTVGAIEGTVTLQFGSTSAVLRLGEGDVYENMDELVAGLNKKLKETNLAEHVSVEKSGDGFKFVISDKDIKAGNNLLKISGSTGGLENIIGNIGNDDANVNHKEISMAGKTLTKNVSNQEYLTGKSITFTLDGVTRSLTFGEGKDIDFNAIEAALKNELETALKSETGETLSDEEFAAELERRMAEKRYENLAKKLEEKLGTKFGEGKIAVSINDKNGFNFSVDNKNTGSVLSISGGKALGLKSNDEATYVNTGVKLSDLGLLTDGDLVKNEGEGKDGKYKLVINNVTLGYLDKDATVQDVLNTINNNTESSVTVSFSKMTNRFLFTAKETGEAGTITFGDGLAKKLFTNDTGSNIEQKQGKDAIFSMTVNGETYDGLTRSSNSFDVDGMVINLKGTFAEELFSDQGQEDWKMGDINSKAAEADAVTFTSRTDSDKIIEAIKNMVKDYNEMANEIKDAYSTMPLYNSKGQRYEPLTEDDERDMSDSAVDRYNEKAKTGILFGDSNLSSLYNDIRSAINELGMTNIGITTEYKDGKTTLVVDEAKLKETLERDPEKVTSVFTQSKNNGAATDGFMEKLKNTMDLYTKTTGKKGILIDLVGSPKSALSLLNNTYKSKMDKMDETIASWQDKLADKIDYYNRQFTRLEQMISQMNSQSSSLMGLMGY